MADAVSASNPSYRRASVRNGRCVAVKAASNCDVHARDPFAYVNAIVVFKCPNDVVYTSHFVVIGPYYNGKWCPDVQSLHHVWVWLCSEAAEPKNIRHT
jgi:hypothetical protein